MLNAILKTDKGDVPVSLSRADTAPQWIFSLNNRKFYTIGETVDGVPNYSPVPGPGYIIGTDVKGGGNDANATDMPNMPDMPTE